MLNGFLYSCLRSTKSQRRAILMNSLKQFNDTARNSLPMMLYLTDNLADIDIFVSVIGCYILQSIEEGLALPAEYEVKDYLAEGEKDKPVEGALQPDEALQKPAIFGSKYSGLKEERDNVGKAKEVLELQEAGPSSASEDLR